MTSTATLLTGLTAGLVPALLALIVFRSLADGVGGACYYPAANSLIGQFHHKTRATAMAIHQTALYCGIVASSVAALVGQHYGWRNAFYLFGVVGMLMAVVVFLRVHDTPMPAGPPGDILVNNAGVEYRKSAAECDEALYDTTLDTNLKGPFFCSQRALAGMKERGWGRVISITSVHDERATGFFAPYGMSKGGLLMMTRELALEYSPFGITVNAIAPGAIRTDINREVLADPQYEAKVIARIPAGRIGEPDDVARVAVFLAGDDARYVTGASLVVDGGWSLR